MLMLLDEIDDSFYTKLVLYEDYNKTSLRTGSDVLPEGDRVLEEVARRLCRGEEIGIEEHMESVSKLCPVE